MLIEVLINREPIEGTDSDPRVLVKKYLLYGCFFVRLVQRPVGLSRQITPRILTEAMIKGGEEAKRAFNAMMKMKKIDVAAIDTARRR